jgi:hypothetical protein
MKKYALILFVAFIGMGCFYSCGSSDEKQLPKNEKDIINDMSKSMDANNEMSIDTTSTDSTVLK